MWQQKTDVEKSEIRKKYKERGGDELNHRVANSIKVSAEIEYNKSSFFGWGSVYMIDRTQAKFTGRAMTTNTQKILDAARLEDDDRVATQSGPK